MPITKSAKKALRVSAKKASRNRYHKDQLKDALKKADASSFSIIDKAAKWGIIHPNKAARLKSRLAKAIGPVTKSVKTDSTPKSSSKTAAKPKSAPKSAPKAKTAAKPKSAAPKAAKKAKK